MQFKDRNFKDEDVRLDGNDYVGCRFENVRMIYAGGELPGFERCEFTSFRFMFEGAADRTVQLLQAMSQPDSGFTQLFRDVFPRS